jgi:FkbM family methyltransferase
MNAARQHSVSFDRSRHLSVDEAEVVAKVLSARQGRQHVMLDIGAHAGGSARHFHSKDWTIYCFEPDPANRAKLVARFGTSASVKIDPRAVGERPQKDVAFFSSPESTGISALHAFRPTHKETERVDVTTGAEIIADNKLTRVDFLKIDVEGFDFAVLNGMPWTKLQPDVVLCEFEDAKTLPLGHSWKEIAAFLQEKGYAVYLSEWHPIIRYGIRHDWRRVVPLANADIPADAWGNILAFRVDPGYAAIAKAFLDAAKGPPVASAPSSAPEARTPAQPRVTPTEATSIAPKAEATPGGGGAPAESFQPERFYAGAANQLRAWSPNAFAMLRFVKKTAGTLWRRKAIFAPAGALLLAWVLAGFLPNLAEWRELIWLSAALAALAITTTYLAFRVRQFMEQSLENRATLLRDLELTQARFARSEAKLLDANGQLLKVESQLTQLKVQVSQAETRFTKQLISAAAQLQRQLADSEAQSKEQLAGIETQLRAQFENAEAHSKEQLAGIETRLRAQFEDFEALKRKLAAAEAKSEAASEQQLRELESLSQGLAALRDEHNRSRDDIADIRATQGDLTDRVSVSSSGTIEAVAKLDDRIETVDKQATFNNAHWYQRFNRRLTSDHIKVLQSWMADSRFPLTPGKIGYMAQRACIAEQRMRGRLATTLEDVLFRTLAALRLERHRLEILEIGTLFGAGVGVMYDILSPHFQQVHVTVIDPLDGYYAAKKPDLLTGEPITEAILRANLSTVGLTDDLTVIKNLSTSEEAVRAAKARHYDVLIIDGDHSYRGVRADFERYSPLIRRNGIVIFDDYGSAEWPDVKRYVDFEMPSYPEFQLAGQEWRTCIYQRKPRSLQENE